LTVYDLRGTRSTVRSPVTRRTDEEAHSAHDRGLDPTGGAGPQLDLQVRALHGVTAAGRPRSRQTTKAVKRPARVFPNVVAEQIRRCSTTSAPPR
jgi:hypothetical protein